jgi:hypothetical protein
MYKWMTVEAVEAMLPTIEAEGVSKIARSSRGFIAAYRRIRSPIQMMIAQVPDHQDQTWGQRRDAFIARTLPAYTATALNTFFFFGKQFHYSLHGEKARIGPEAAAGPVSNSKALNTHATSMSYVPSSNIFTSTGNITAASFTGPITGNASSATQIATTSSATTNAQYVTFSDVNGGTSNIRTSVGLTY